VKTYLDIHDIPAARSANVDASLVGQSQADAVRRLLGSVPSGLVYCLVEAPDRETASRAHREAHGLIAHTLLEVKSESLGLVTEAPSDPAAGLARPS
jgi:hypothetical protein